MSAPVPWIGDLGLGLDNILIFIQEAIAGRNCQAPTQLPSTCSLQLNLTHLRDEWELVLITS